MRQTFQAASQDDPIYISLHFNFVSDIVIYVYMYLITNCFQAVWEKETVPVDTDEVITNF